MSDTWFTYTQDKVYSRFAYDFGIEGGVDALKKYENVEQRVEFITAVEFDEKSLGTL
jgi:hypothetical protein